MLQARQSRRVDAADVIEMEQNRQLDFFAGLIHRHHERMIERQPNLVLAEAAAAEVLVAFEERDQAGGVDPAEAIGIAAVRAWIDAAEGNDAIRVLFVGFEGGFVRLWKE